MDKEKEERETAKKLANDRVAGIYKGFDQANIKYNKVFFE